MAATAIPTQDWAVALATDSAAAGQWYRSHSGDPDVLVGSGADAVDRWVPLGVDVSWYYVSEQGVDRTPTVRLDPGGPVLASTVTGTSMVVTVVKQTPLSWQGRSVAHDILDGPPVSTIGRPTYHEAELVLHVPDTATRSRLRSLLGTGHPLVLRAPCRGAVDDVTLQPQSWSEDVPGGDPSGQRRTMIRYKAVTAEAAAYRSPPQWTWADVEAGYESWAALEAVFGTWALLEAGP